MSHLLTWAFMMGLGKSKRILKFSVIPVCHMRKRRDRLWLSYIFIMVPNCISLVTFIFPNSRITYFVKLFTNYLLEITYCKRKDNSAHHLKYYFSGVEEPLTEKPCRVSTELHHVLLNYWPPAII